MKKWRDGWMEEWRGGWMKIWRGGWMDGVPNPQLDPDPPSQGTGVIHQVSEDHKAQEAVLLQ